VIIDEVQTRAVEGAGGGSYTSICDSFNQITFTINRGTTGFSTKTYSAIKGMTFEE
jgi:hypothetical protein